MKELNVIGTMQLLAACQRAPSVRRFVLKSTSAVYGASSRDPAVFTETMQARAVPSGGFAKDSLDIEGYVRAFARRRPDVDVASLRFTNFIGPADRLAAHRLLPHARRADRARLRRPRAAAARGRRPGGPHPRDHRRLRRHGERRRRGHDAAVPGHPPPGPDRGPAPTPTLGSVGRLSRRFGFVDYSPEQMRFLNFGRVVDTTVLREEFGYTPRYTTEAALADYARTVPPVVSPGLVESATGRGSARCSSGPATTASAVGGRLRPAPPAPGLRAVRDA